MLWFCSDGSVDVGAARHSKKSAKALSSMPDGELNEDILASLGQLLTSSASSLGDLLKMVPTVSRLSDSDMTESDSHAVKRRRVSHRPTAALPDLLASSQGKLSTTSTANHQSALSPYFAGFYFHYVLCLL